jgi:hypothetical protein
MPKTLVAPCGCREHACDPSPTQTERYLVEGGYELCALCASLGHMAPRSPLYRRRENRVCSCLLCGETLGIYVEGARVPEFAHDCD